MPGRIRQDDLDAVRQRTDIVKVVSGHLQLKKAGADRFVGLCPFHPEKTPSFGVTPSKQLYHCFGCGEGGDVFRFIEKVENLSFSEVVEKLAAEAGVTLRYEGGRDQGVPGRRQALHRVLAEAARLYHRTLLEAKEGGDARDYLSSRGISQDSIERFGVGYAPGYPDFLLRRLSRAFSPELLVEAGLASRGSDGGLRDRFRGRVMFPIHDLSGNAVGFGGRLLAGATAPPNAAKYVNSPESPVYRKGSLLYNLNRAKTDITRAGRAFLVEGYTDVIGLDQVGVREAVATCGTALGEEHIRLLSRFTSKVILAFDSDDAGARAAERAHVAHERYQVDLAVLVLPAGSDPADFVLERGDAAAFLELADGATPLIGFMIDRALRGKPLAAPEDQARAVREGLPIVAQLGDQVLRERYAGVLADKAGVSVNSVLLELQRLGPQAAAEAATVAKATARTPAQRVEREALKLLIQAPVATADRLASLRPASFSTATHQRVFEFLIEQSGGGIPADAATLVARAQERGEQLAKLLTALAVEPLEADPGEEAGPDHGYVDRVFLRLEEFALTRAIEDLRRRLERLNPLTATQEYDAMFEELVKLEGDRRAVRTRAEAVGSSA